MKVVILAGGKGSRISFYTQKIPKPMITIGNIPLLIHIIDIYKFYGFKEFIVATGYKSEVIENYFLNKKKSFIYNNILSEEGGRFYHSQINYKALYLKKNEEINKPNTYIWLSHNQIVDFIKKQQIDIEARLLFGIINIKETI